MRDGFLSQHVAVFEDTEENKLEYMIIFKEWVRDAATFIPRFPSSRQPCCGYTYSYGATCTSEVPPFRCHIHSHLFNTFATIHLFYVTVASSISLF